MRRVGWTHMRPIPSLGCEKQIGSAKGLIGKSSLKGLLINVVGPGRWYASH